MSYMLFVRAWLPLGRGQPITLSEAWSHTAPSSTRDVVTVDAQLVYMFNQGYLMYVENMDDGVMM